MVCGKTIYTIREEAAKAISGINSSTRIKTDTGKLKGSYFCQDCNGWHISSGFKQSKSKKIPYVINDEVNSSQRIKKHNDEKSGTKNLIIHTRLNFKVK